MKILKQIQLAINQFKNANNIWVMNTLLAQSKFCESTYL